MKKYLRLVWNYWFFRIVFCFSALAIFYTVTSFILLRVLPIQRVSDTNISGIIIRNQVWEGTIRIIGDTVFLPGTRLEIKPGTKVLIIKEGDRFNLDFNPRHVLRGINTGPDDHGIIRGEPYWNEQEKVQVRFWSVYAMGTAAQPIEISSEDGSAGSPYDINLLTISRGSLSGVRLSNYRRLEIGPNVAIYDSQFTNTGNCAVCISYGEPLIFGNVFRNSRRFYISVGLASPKIEGNSFLQSEGGGLLFSGDKYSNLRVKNNLFNIPQKTAIEVAPEDEGGEISKNFFSAGTIQLPCNSKVFVVDNWIRGNVVFNNPSCTGTYIFGSNYWETDDIGNVLQTRISGSTDKFKIEMPVILKQLPMGVKTR